MQPQRLSEPGALKTRVVSVDAYRGFVMFLMLAEALRSCAVYAAVPSSYFLNLLCYEQTHAAWVGASLHDLIQPSFYFLVGVGLLLSIRRRLSAGQTLPSLAHHTLVRSVALIVLGMALVSVHPRQWTWMFVDTLTQIGLAYPFLFIIALRPKRVWYVAFIGILIGYWLWFALYPLPSQAFDYAAVGVPWEWLTAHGLTGFAAHWQKNSNAAWAVDRWFMNLFPRDAPFTGAENGLTTLNFIPSIGTMILGLFAGDLIRGTSGWQTVRTLFATGVVLLVTASFLGVLGIVPIVKAIWTPSWVLYSGGWCFLILAAFYCFVDVTGFKRLAFPLIVIGMNSVVAYSLSNLYPALAFNTLRRVFGNRVFEFLGGAYEPMIYGSTVLLLYWLILYALYQRRIFIRS